MAKTLWKVSHKNCNLGANEEFVMFLTSKLITCFIEGFTSKKIPINCLYTQWKWTYILDFGPWKWSALNMGYMDKRPSRMQGSCHGWGVRPGSWGQGSGSSSVARACHPDTCNGRWGYLDRPVLRWLTFLHSICTYCAKL